MKNFSQIINEPYKNTEADTNEIVGVLLASACLALACGPLLSGIGERIAKGGDKKDKSGATFWDFLISRSKKSDDNKSDDNKSDNNKSDDNKIFNELLMMSKKSNEKEKDENTKKKNDTMIKLLTACSFDKDGNEIPLEERINKMKDTMSPEQFESFKKDMTETYEKNKDNQDFKDALVKAKANIKPEEYDKMIDEAKKEAKATLEQLDKEKKDIEEYEKKLADLDDQINGGDEKDKEIKELKKQLEELKSNPPKTLASEATGVSAVAGSTQGDPKSDPKEPEGDPKGDPKSDPKEPEGDPKGDPKSDPKEPEGDPKGEPKQMSAEDIKKEHDKIEKDYKDKSAALEKEYQDKIDKETDKDKKAELEKEWMKKEKALSAEKNKKMDDIDDTDEHKDDDETKQGKYKVKDEEIEDPKTGEKIKVKTFTGPRGGKFYYPDGKPKKPENKVYVESVKLPLSIYLIRSQE